MSMGSSPSKARASGTPRSPPKESISHSSKTRQSNPSRSNPSRTDHVDSDSLKARKPLRFDEPIAEEPTVSADDHDRYKRPPNPTTSSPDVDSNLEKPWLDLRFTDKNETTVVKPDQLIKDMQPVPKPETPEIKNRIAGSMLGMAVGDALGAHVEFRPHDFLVEHPVTDLSSGGTWGLSKGQFTDDTSMALCLAISLITRREMDLYDQLVRYKWWHKHGYMSSTGQCFDIGKATKQSIDEFGYRQYLWAEKHKIPPKQIDHVRDPRLLKDFDVHCSKEGVAGNGALMRLAPVPLFFFRHPPSAVEYSGQSGEITHGDQKAIDSCRYYGALIVAALQGHSKDEILDNYFYDNHRDWFGKRPLHPDILSVAQGSYKKDEGYGSGIRGSGYTVQSLEAALWAFWSTTAFKEGALAAVNLGDDTDTTAAIYGQLAGAFYGLRGIPEQWRKEVFAREFILNVSDWIGYEGAEWCRRTHPEAYRQYEVVVDRREPKKAPIDKKVPAPSVGAVGGVTPKPAPKPPKPTPSRPVPPTPSSEEKGPIGPIPDEKYCQNWSSDDVYRWLLSKGKPLCDQADEFRKRKVNGAVLLAMIDETKIPCGKWATSREKQALIKEVKNLQRVAAERFIEQFEGADYIAAMHLFEHTKNMTSRTLRSNDSDGATMYNQIIDWMEYLPEGMHVSKIELLYDPNQLRLFLEQVITSELKKKNCDSDPHFDKDKTINERSRALQRLKQLERRVKHRREISVVRVWYGCSANDTKTLIKQGFQEEDKKKDGPFGNGFYFNSSAMHEASRAGTFGCLIMCYVILVNPYPIIAVDAPQNEEKTKFRFYGRTAEGTYDSHYIPVARLPLKENKAEEVAPPGGVESAEYDRIVVFNPSNILQQCVVHLQNGSKSSDPKPSPSSPAKPKPKRK